MKKVLLMLCLFLLFSCGGYTGNYSYSALDISEYGLETSYAIAFPKGSNLVPHFSEIINRLKNDNTLECLTNYWTEEKNDPCYNNINFTTKIYDYNHDGGGAVLDVLTSSGYDPFEMSENNVLTGFDIDLAKLITKELNYRINWNDVLFEKIVGDLTNNRAHFAIAAITPTAERSQSIDFSVSYYDESQTVVLFREENNINANDLRDKIVCALNGTVQAQLLTKMQNSGKVKNTVLLPYAANAMESLRSGKVDVFLVERTTAKGLLETYNK